MADMDATQVAIGAGGGVLGGGVAVLNKRVGPSQTVASILCGAGLGAFVPVFVNQYWELPPFGSGGIGFVMGLCALLFIPMIQETLPGIAQRVIGKKANDISPGKQP